MKAPRLEEGRLSYSIELLEGTVPSHAGRRQTAADRLGRPIDLTPSVA
jgi:hypothetical protein